MALSILAIVIASFHANGFADPAQGTEVPAQGVQVPGPPAEVPPAPSGAQSQLAFILDNPLPESEYAESKRCVFPNSYRSVEILDGRHLLFWGYRGNVWLNQLRAECLGLKKDSLLVFELRERTLCDMDSFIGTPRAATMSPFAVHCMLGDFETISEVQANALRVALERHAQSPTPAPKSTDEQ